MLDIEKVKTLREKLGLTQQAAATAAGMTSRQQWNDIECGRKVPTLETLNRVASALGVKAAQLLK